MIADMNISATLACPIPNWSRTITRPEYTIRQPYIDTVRHMGIITTLYDSFAAAYNNMVSEARKEGDLTQQPLRATHRALFIDLVHMAKGQMNRHAYTMRDARRLLSIPALEPYSLHTNRRELAERSKKSEISIYRQLMRLIDAGLIIKKIHHGTQRDFELLINPLIMPISDLENDRFDPVSAIIEFTGLRAFPDTLRSKCTPYRYIQEHSNNVEIPVNKPEQKKESAAPIAYNEQNRNIYGNTGRTAEMPEVPAEINDFSTDGSGTISGINDFSTEEYAAKMRRQEQRIAERTKRWSVMLVEYMLRILFSGHNIYPGERQKAYTMAEHYFSGLQTEQQYSVAMEQYRRRVDMVARYLERHPEFTFRNIYPSAYLNPQNTRCGFIATRKWEKQQQQFLQLKKAAKVIRTEQAVFENAITRWHQSHTLENYIKISGYVKTKIPHRLDDFNAAVACVAMRK